MAATSVGVLASDSTATTSSSSGFSNPSSIPGVDIPSYITQYNASTNAGTYEQITLTALSGLGQVIFTVTPEIEENGTSNYMEISEIFQPASILIWTGSPSRTWTINAKLVSRTVADATTNYGYKSTLQAWRMPLATGAAPDVIFLNGYYNQFQSIPTVLVSLNISFPIDVDYISASNGASVPIIMPISLTLKEYHPVSSASNAGSTTATGGGVSALDTFPGNYASYLAGQLTEWN